MTTVTVSPKFQIVIPLEIRQSLHVFPGEKLQVIRYDNRIELIPFRPIKKMRGFLKGMNANVEREKKDRL